MTDLSLERIAAAPGRIDPAFLGTPQTLHDGLLGRAVVVKDETGTPIGSFKGRGACLLAERLDPALTWVCATAGNFGQGLAYAARAHGASVEAFVSPAVGPAKLAGMRALGARVYVAPEPERAAREHAAAGEDRFLVTDGLGTEMAEGAATIAIELQADGPFDVALVQVGDGALAAGVACRLKATRPDTRVIGVCAHGAPAMARSYAAGQVVTTPGTDTIATAIAISTPIAQSVDRLVALLDDIVLVDDDDLRAAQQLIRSELGVAVEAAGAAGVAALARHGERLPAGRTAVLLTGAG